MVWVVLNIEKVVVDTNAIKAIDRDETVTQVPKLRVMTLESS